MSSHWPFSISWSRLCRIKYCHYLMEELGRKHSVEEVVRMKPAQFVRAADWGWKRHCKKRKGSHAVNERLDANWRDDHCESDRFCDYQEFMRRELREYFGAITVWNRGKGGVEATKSLLKKNKKRLRSGGKTEEKKSKIETLAEKQERREYLET